MIIDSKHELLMLMIGLEQVSEMILEHDRAEEWHQRTYMSLFNRIAEEYNQMVSDEEELMVELLVEA